MTKPQDKPIYKRAILAPADEYPEFSETERLNIGVLDRRRRHLAQRVTDSQRGRMIRYDRAELQALTWVLDLLKAEFGA